MAAENAETSVRKSPFSTILLLVGVAFVVGGLFALYGVLGFSLALTAFGSLFLYYWAGILHQNWAEFVPSLVGGLVGIALAWLLLTGGVLWGMAGVVAGFVALATALYFYLRGEARTVFNNATMLVLLVATIPELRIADTVAWMAASLLIGAAWIGTISWVAGKVRAAWARRSA